MKDKDIQKLFQEKLGNHELPVNPELWAGVQSGLSGAAGAGGSAAAGTAIMKFIVAAAIVSGIATGTYLLWPEEQPSEKVTEIKTEHNIAQEEEPQTEEQQIDSEVPVELDEEVHIAQKPDEEKQITSEQNNTPEIESTEVIDNEAVSTQSDEQETQSLVTEERAEGTNSEEPSTQTTENEEPFETPEYAFAVEIDQNSPMEISYTLGTDRASAKWSFGDGTTSTLKGGKYQFKEEGVYMVQVESTDEAGNVSRFEQEIKAYHDPVLSLPNVFSPGATPGSNDYYDIDKFASKHIDTYTIRIYSGDGQELIFESNEYNRAWDGNDKFGNPMQEGYYLAIVHAENAIGKSVDETERVLLKR